MIKALLSRRHKTETAASTSDYVNWTGHSGTQYPYVVYPLDAEFPPLPGNYIYAGQAEDGTWVPLYVAQTRGMHQRLEGHEKLQQAIELGATHIHVHLTAEGQASRCTEEHDLIVQYHPRCNDAVEG